MSIEYQLFQLADYDEVVALWRASEGVSVGTGDSRENIAAFLERNPGLSYVVRDEDRVVAAAMCGHDGRRGFIYHLAVAPSHRRHGLGSELVRRCLDGLAAAGIGRCHVFVFAENGTAREFWQAAGGRLRDDLAMFSLPVAFPADATAGNLV